MIVEPAGFRALAPGILATVPGLAQGFDEAVFEAKRLRFSARPECGRGRFQCCMSDRVLGASSAGSQETMLQIYVSPQDRIVATAAEMVTGAIDLENDDDNAGRDGGIRSADGTVWYVRPKT